MTLRELLKRDFDTDLDISGGYGNSINNCIRIHKTRINDYVGTEYYILKCLGIGRRIEWKTLGQSLLSDNNRTIDKVKIETKQITETEIITQIENYYFDITECFENENKDESLFDEENTMKQIKERILQLEQENSFNKNCIDLLKKEKLFENTKLTIDFIDIIFNDKSLPLFESMMNNRRQPIMDVLRTIGNELNKTQE
ncbi:MAG: hypothetical protein RIR12_1772 [Bacteroidota bacterium]|jgi:hypothetical protein